MTQTVRLARFAWCTYDWANSGFPTVITTYVFAVYFAKTVTADDATGASLWAFAMSASSLAVGIASPVLGAIADAGGRRKPWVAVFSIICIGATLSLWNVTPGDDWVLYALVLAAVANFGFEAAVVFYNALLPTLAPRSLLGRLSGWGWGLGSAGSVCCLAACLLLLVQPRPPLFGLSSENFEPVRATAVLVAGWFALFALPFFLLVPDSRGPGLGIGRSVHQGIAALVDTFSHFGRYPQLMRFLFARMIYTDGLNAISAVGGIYVAVTFGMDQKELLTFGIAMTIMNGIGAVAFGWIDDWIGAKQTILIALIAIVAIGLGLMAAESRAWLWVLAMPLGIVIGPAHAASRSFMARHVPAGKESEMFGLYALSGKATAFLGPAAFGWVTQATGNPQAGLAAILVFVVVGALLLLLVRDPDRTDRACP